MNSNQSKKKKTTTKTKQSPTPNPPKIKNKKCMARNLNDKSEWPPLFTLSRKQVYYSIAFLSRDLDFYIIFSVMFLYVR